ncbi:hypothetical protein BCR35DRAFT_303266 [Leucosporidium creatinivorum]|uniref:Uncharacterized protein n=1 Tax=Leucosporidium creatinivorum TaxID=106004 RepID=A0A1Y2FJP8_9BASI|nr:hypothetical protein BCR35DRAFT_303266 [Leucosporidium creatinivorum]
MGQEPLSRRSFTGRGRQLDVFALLLLSTYSSQTARRARVPSSPTPSTALPRRVSLEVVRSLRRAPRPLEKRATTSSSVPNPHSTASNSPSSPTPKAYSLLSTPPPPPRRYTLAAPPSSSSRPFLCWLSQSLAPRVSCPLPPMLRAERKAAPTRRLARR